MSNGHGGRRQRAGRKPDPLSARSLERRGALVELPVEGYDGPVPAFPLPDPVPRELELWEWAWSLPQAAMWAEERWRRYTAAMWCRWSARMELPDATAATGAVTTRLADQLGLTPSGLVDQGWTIGPARVSTGRWQVGVPQSRPSVRDRLRNARSEDDDEQSPPAEPRPSSLERARRRAEERDHAVNARDADPRAVLRDDYRAPGSHGPA